MKKAKIGYQVYSAREEAEKDLYGVLTELKKYGYDGVELAGFYHYSAGEIASMLKDTGMEAISDHVPFARLNSDIDNVIEEHLAIGCRYIAVPFMEEAYRPGKPGFADVIRNVYTIGSKCSNAGIQLLYHNHDFEFEIISGMYGLDFLYAAVDSDILKTEIDTCWVRYSGVDPCDYVRKYRGRAPIVHLKDYVGKKVITSLMR